MSEECNTLWNKVWAGRYKQYSDFYSKALKESNNKSIEKPADLKNLEPPPYNLIAPIQNYAGFDINIQISLGDYGRYIRTNQHLTSGQTILSALPFATAVEPTRIKYCYYCHRTVQLPIRCEECKYVFYCNESCMLNKQATHILECGSDFRQIVDTDVKCAIQAVLEAISMFANLDQLITFVEGIIIRGNEIQNDRPAQIITKRQQLECILKLYRKQLTEEECTNSRLAVSFLSNIPNVKAMCPRKAQEKFLQHLVRNFYAVVLANSFSQRLDHVGAGQQLDRTLLYDSISFFNHSCVPNVRIMIENTRMIGHALHGIAQGTELNISYFRVVRDDQNEITTFRNKASRLERTRGWGFDCICRLCQDLPDPTNEEFRAILALGKNQLTTAMAQANRGNDLNYYIRLLCYIYSYQVNQFVAANAYVGDP